ncbi:MAG: GntR family transcriptional regulator [Clostridia bacterium]|nr:GntR family transcriptional regulator [Clostridia bacterium]
MITVDLKSRVPIYEQIVDSVKSAILSGLLGPDEQLPAVRKLAVELAINPNTIQKAYTILEAQSIVYSIPGRGSFVSADTGALADAHHAKLISELKQLLDDAKRSGISKKEILDIVNGYGE